VEVINYSEGMKNII